jgi:GNAT superfamily N-acetyltransferase
MTQIRPLAESDRAEWLPLWLAYLDFYEHQLSEAQTSLTFRRLVDEEFPMYGAMAWDGDDRAIGLVHWLTHPATWSHGAYCYLEDLFVSPGARGTGAGSALIRTVSDWALEHGNSKVYWLTAETNATARALYDRVATHTGFVHYEIGLGDD